MVAAPNSRTRSSLIPKVLVIAALALLSAVAGVAPFVVPPAGVFAGIGLGGFQILLAALAGLLGLIVLLAASATGIFWPQFLRPADYWQGVARSFQGVGWALGAVIALFIAMAGIGFVGFATDTATPPGWETVQNWLRGLIMVAAVAGAVCVARSCILLVRMLTRAMRGGRRSRIARETR
ncbi:MAG: hypothetical protein ACRDFS_01495 [Chloroflexota bacterium]